MNIFTETFFTNPQYLIQVANSDVEGGDGLCTLICACLQKNTRQKRQQTGLQQAEEYINLRLYKVCFSYQIDSTKDSMIDQRFSGDITDNSRSQILSQRS